MRERRLARILTVLGVPSGAAFFAAAVPGPCTTFDDTSPIDAAALCDVALQVRFDPGGAEDASTCQDFVSQHCCGPQASCAESPGCRDWIACYNACPFPKQKACVSGCGAPMTEVSTLVSCAVEAGLPDGCGVGQL